MNIGLINVAVAKNTTTGASFLSIKAFDATGTEYQFSAPTSGELVRILNGSDPFKRSADGKVQKIIGTNLLALNKPTPDALIQVETLPTVSEEAKSYTSNAGHVNEYILLKFTRGTETFDI